MMRRSFLSVGLLPLVLAACGGSETTVTETGPNGLPYGTTGLIASKDRFEDFEDTTITAKGYLAEYDSSAGFAASSKGVTGKVTLLEPDRMRLVLDGTTYTLTSVNNGASFSVGDVTVFPAFSGSGNGTNSVFLFKVSDTTGPEYLEAFLLSGFETRKSELTGSASYVGGAGMLARDSGGTDIPIFDDAGNLLAVGATASGSANPGTPDNGRLAMTANFGNNTVSGTITADNSAFNVPLSLVMTGTVSNNSMSGTFTDATGNLTSGVFRGAFYGEDARDVAGGLKASVAATGDVADATEGVGFFVGAQ